MAKKREIQDMQNETEQSTLLSDFEPETEQTDNDHTSEDKSFSLFGFRVKLPARPYEILTIIEQETSFDKNTIVAAAIIGLSYLTDEELDEVIQEVLRSKSIGLSAKLK